MTRDTAILPVATEAPLTGGTAPAGVPQHVAIIMDGNGRWARRRGLPRVAGHRRGVEIVRKSIEWSIEFGVRHLTLFAFSSENWSRPPAEIKVLMELLGSTLESETPRLVKNGVRLTVIGDIARFGQRLQSQIRLAEQATADNDRIDLIIAANYGGRWDICTAAQRLAEQVKAGELDPADIDETRFAGALSAPGIPDPDLMIRTSGEHRISNFLMWQLAYAELYFSDCYWPEFSKDEYGKALSAYACRERRFGGVDSGASVEAQRA